VTFLNHPGLANYCSLTGVLINMLPLPPLVKDIANIYLLSKTLFSLLTSGAPFIPVLLCVLSLTMLLMKFLHLNPCMKES
jgi:hypothetical protein